MCQPSEVRGVSYGFLPPSAAGEVSCSSPAKPNIERMRYRIAVHLRGSGFSGYLPGPLTCFYTENEMQNRIRAVFVRGSFLLCVSSYISPPIRIWTRAYESGMACTCPIVLFLIKDKINK